MAPKKANYGNESISALKGADRVRKRPGVIFGSDGLEGCEHAVFHAVFEILSNAIDEAREGHGSLITVTRYLDKSIQVEDQGRGCPVDWNENEQKYNWEGGDGDNYEYSLGLNGLGSCATQYASEYFDAAIWRDGFKYSLHFEKGENIGGEGAHRPGKKDGHHHPLEARPGGLYRHRHPGGLLHRRAQAPGGGQRRGHLPLSGGDRPRKILQHRFSV